VSLPSHKVVGDVDVVTLDDKGAFAYVADIAGHGLQAGSFMGIVKAAVRSLLLNAQDPCTRFQGLNSVLPGLKENEMYATCAALQLTISWVHSRGIQDDDQTLLLTRAV
jgi:serine phosphatase RsbU (regulator of sigma subunit)